MKYEILDWDTGFFGVKVACITEPFLDKNRLFDIIFELNHNGIHIAYWPSCMEFDEIVIKRLGGILADVKTTFTIDFRGLNSKEFRSTDIVESYTESMGIKDLENLAIQSGQYSRFAVDPNIPREKFVALYKRWIERSLKKEIAEDVLVIREGERVVGMVTLVNQSGRGDIGLIAVDRNNRGKQFGEILVCAAQRWFVDRGYSYGQVVTQGRNIPACNLYNKCGYSVGKVEYIYHFHL